MSKQARLFLITICLAGFATVIYGGIVWKIAHPAKFAAYLLVALLASRLKVELPEITGTISVNFLFILIGIAELTFSETLLLGCSAILVQCLLTKRRWPRLEQVLFNVSSAAIAIWVAYFVYHGPLNTLFNWNSALLLMLSAAVYFLFNTLPVAAIISLTENKSLQKIWTDCYFWSLPYYLAGGAIAALFGWINQKVGWQPTLLALPAMFVIYRSYRLYVGRLENEKTMWRRWPLCTCAPLKPWPWPLKPRTRPRMTIWSVCVFTPWKWPSGSTFLRTKWKRCALLPCCMTSASWPCPNTLSPSRAG